MTKHRSLARTSQLRRRRSRPRAGAATTLPGVFDDISTPVQARVVELLLKLSAGLRRLSWDRAAAAGLTPTQAEILRTLKHAPAGLRLSEVAAALGVSAPTASEAVASLEGKRLLLRQPSLDDRRVLRLTLTLQGSVLAAELEEWFESVEAAVSTLPSESKSQLLVMLMQVFVTLQKTAGMPTTKACVNCRYFSPNVSSEPSLPHRCELVGAPFGDQHLRVNCPEQEPAAARAGAETWMDSATRKLVENAGSSRRRRR